MPRGKKKVVLTIDEQIEGIKKQIDSLTEELKEKKIELKNLEAAKANEEKEKLISAIEASGKSYEEIMQLLKTE